MNRRFDCIVNLGDHPTGDSRVEGIPGPLTDFSIKIRGNPEYIQDPHLAYGAWIEKAKVLARRPRGFGIHCSAEIVEYPQSWDYYPAETLSVEGFDAQLLRRQYDPAKGYGLLDLNNVETRHVFSEAVARRIRALPVKPTCVFMDNCAHVSSRRSTDPLAPTMFSQMHACLQVNSWLKAWNIPTVEFWLNTTNVWAWTAQDWDYVGSPETKAVITGFCFEDPYNTTKRKVAEQGINRLLTMGYQVIFGVPTESIKEQTLACTPIAERLGEGLWFARSWWDTSKGDSWYTYYDLGTEPAQTKRDRAWPLVPN